MKLWLKGWRFISIEGSKQELQQILNMLTLADFSEYLQEWQKRWDCYMQAQVDYFEGDGGN